MASRLDHGALALSVAADGDDDDDFQDPAAARIRLLSSIQNPSHRPLKSSDGSRLRKRPRPSDAPGKENRRDSFASQPKSRVLKASEEKMRDLEAPIDPRSLGSRLVSVSSPWVSPMSDMIERKSGKRMDDSMEMESVVEGNGRRGGKSSLLTSSGHKFLENRHVPEIDSEISGEFRGECILEIRNKEEKLHHFMPNRQNSMENGASRADFWNSKGCGDGEVLKIEKGNLYSMSIESRLLGSIRKSGSSRAEVSGLLEGGCCDEFEPGTQLNELINLCAEMEGSDFSNKALGLGDSESMECPLCGKNITDLSEELRHVHTNDCLEGMVDSDLLLDSARSSSDIGHGSVEGDVCGDMMQSVELDVSKNLGSEVGVEGVSSVGVDLSDGNELGVNTIMLERNVLVGCPLCGTDITALTEVQRQVHTNGCLDRDVGAKVTIPDGVSGSDSRPQVVDVNLVLGWLRTLGLSKYEEAFVREEVDWETLQWLTEEDLISIGITALGPRKKIVHALNEIRKRNNHPLNIDVDVPHIAANNDKQLAVPANKLITEYFQGPVDRNRICSTSRQLHGAEKGSKDSVRRRVGASNHINKGKSRDIPPWCSIPGTPFRVDAFCYLRGDCSHWFLTHFHIDHYQGLTRNFCHGKIYCSSITAHLVNMKIGLSWDRLHILPLNQKINIAGVNLTCLDANHCPGSIMILFEPPNGKAVLHTGDFRFSEEIASNSVLQSCRIHTLMLDTTYCNPQYDFPKQEAVIQFVIEAIQAEAFNPKTLFLIGSYTIGKEKLFLEVARLMKKKVYVGAAKLRILSCLGFSEEDMQWFTTNEMESQIHVVPMWTIASFKRMKHISNQYLGRFNLIVAFSPTGWTFGKGKKKTPGRRWQQGTIIRYEVPYSEHSSFTELREFVQLVSPEKIIPSVNNEGPQSVDAMITLLASET